MGRYAIHSSKFVHAVTQRLCALTLQRMCFDTRALHLEEIVPYSHLKEGTDHTMPSLSSADVFTVMADTANLCPVDCIS